MVLSSGVAVEYDWLVLALGADSVFFGIEGVKEHCIPFCSYPDAMKVLNPLVPSKCATVYNSKPMKTTAAPHLAIRGFSLSLTVQVEAELRALEARPGTAEVLVVGTGYAGIELATTVAERLGSKGQVRMVTAGRRPLPHPKPVLSFQDVGQWGLRRHHLQGHMFVVVSLHGACRKCWCSRWRTCCGCAGKEILEGCPAGQQAAARKSLQEQSVPVITEALVTRVGLTESQPASTSQPARKSITLKTPTTDNQACPTGA